MALHPPASEIEEACHHILWVWFQYGPYGREGEETGDIYLSHSHMWAGQTAGDFLLERGYVEDDGEAWIVTPKGRALMGREST